eukprot:jgi/Bigna1/141307/aug1.61_g16015
MKSTKVGEIFASVVGNENFKEAGQVRKNDYVYLNWDKGYEVWEVMNRNENKSSIEQECKVLEGNTSLLNKTMVIKITILASPIEVPSIDEDITRALEEISRSDLWVSVRQKREQRRKKAMMKANKSENGINTIKQEHWQGNGIKGPMGLGIDEGAAPSMPNGDSAGKGGGGGGGDNDSQIVKTEVHIDLDNDFDKLFSNSDHENLTEKEPSYRVSAKLYGYQKQGLHWMCEQERERRGGILADEMGLGKTIQIISLVAESARDKLNQLNMSGPRTTLIICPLSVITNWEMQAKKHIRLDNRLSIHTYHGSQRIKDESKLKDYDVVITTYEIVRQEWKMGSSKTKGGSSSGDKSEVVVSEEMKRKQQRALISWQQACDVATRNGRNPPEKPKILRDMSGAGSGGKKQRGKKSKSSSGKKSKVLDEAHTIRHRNTLMSQACVALKAERRWCITGTPFQNTIDDAFALLSFIRVDPFGNYPFWSEYVSGPLKNQNNREEGMERLQKIMTAICLRRKKSDKIKGRNILPLPPKKDIIQKIKLSDYEQKIYDALAKSGKKKFRSMMRSDILRKEQYAYVLQMLLRMRQACDDINLVPSKYHNGFISTEHLNWSEQILSMWENGAGDECTICYGKPEDPCIASGCGHIYCKSCMEEAIEKAEKEEEEGGSGMGLMCAECDQPIQKNEILTKEQMDELKKQESEREKKRMENAKNSNFRSSKMKTLLKALQKIGEMDRTFKAVIFSQFTSMLDIVKTNLNREGYKCVRIDGRMSNQSRKKAITDFAQDPRVKIFLISLKAGGMGLNLTQANTVFLLDPWWNPAAEDQAVARIHRCGQKKPVNIFRFITQNTVEEKILDLQKAKQEMMTTALTRYKRRTKKQMKADRIKRIKTLFK